MSAAKRVKLELDIGEKPAVKEAEVIVDLGNGLLGRLSTHGSGDDTIQEERWLNFKAELHQSDFWQQYKERLDNPEREKSEEGSEESYNEVVEREIQRAWDESGKGSKVLRMPQSIRRMEFRNSTNSDGELSMPDIPLCDHGVNSIEGREPRHGKRVGPVELKKDIVMNLNAGGMQRYLVTIEYLGTRFLGWQKQKHRPDLRTVQGALEEAFNKFAGKPVVCGGSSRTDAGVHALANVCHVDVERVSKRKSGEVVPSVLTSMEIWQKDGGDVVVVDVKPVRNDFHSRFQARERTYHYRILSGCAHSSIFEKDRAWHVPGNLNLAAMQAAAEVLVGHHDFSSFRAAGCQAKSPVKTLDELHVRLLVGTLKAVGCGVLIVEEVKGVLAAKSIKATPAMAPAHGLYLAEVNYNLNEFKTRENMTNEDEGEE